MAEGKTRPTGLSVTACLNAIDDETRRKDCKELDALMTRRSLLTQTRCSCEHMVLRWGKAHA
jgi:hypothetical protein